MIDNTFYNPIGNRVRDSRELIKSRLRIYLPFIMPLKAIYEECKIVDLGCGRGEWLELMAEVGFEAHGVDLDGGMLAAHYPAGISVTEGDAIEYLKMLQDECIAVISGFHMVEHISFADLQTLVNEAFRVLKPGGLLIIEIQNLENSVVETANLCLDPIHQRLIPPTLLSFLAKCHGFSRIKLLRPQEQASILFSENIGPMDIFMDINPDFAIVAQKNAQKKHQILFDSVFERDYGFTANDLAQRNDIRNRELMSEIQSASRSWRIISLLPNTFGLLLKAKATNAGFLGDISCSLGGVISPILDALICFAVAHPSFKRRALALVYRYPPLYKRLYDFATLRGIVDSSSYQIYKMIPSQQSDLSPFARCIYADLQLAIERQNQDDY